MERVDALRATSPSSLFRNSLYSTTLSATPYSATPYYSSFLHERDNMVTRARLIEEDALRWRTLAESMQQEQDTLATSECMAQANLHVAKAEIEKQGQQLKTTDAQLLTVRDDLRRLHEASQHKEELLAGEVASLKNQLVSSRADNHKLKQDLEALEYTSKQRGQLITVGSTQMHELRMELDMTKVENVRCREELTVSRAEGERLKLLLDAETANVKRQGELLLLKDSEIKEKSSEVVKLRSDLEMQMARNQKVESDLSAYQKSLQETSDALKGKTTDCEKLTVELADTKSREISQDMQVQRMEQDARFWSEAYLLRHKGLGYVPSDIELQRAYSLASLPPPGTSVYRSKLLDAQAKAAAFEGTMSRIRGELDGDGRYHVKAVGKRVPLKTRTPRARSCG